jgi:hypothetical protein
MGIRASYRRITPDEFAELQNNPESAKTLLSFDNIDFNLDQYWQALHFLITGESGLQAYNSLPPHFNVVFGGTPTQFETDYGFVRYLNPEEVSDVSNLLNTISTEELKQKFDPDEFNAEMIYPLAPDKWNIQAIEELLDIFYPKLVSFFKDADRDKNIVLLSCD